MRAVKRRKRERERKKEIVIAVMRGKKNEYGDGMYYILFKKN